MANANRVPSRGPSPGKEAVVRVVEAQANAMRVQVAALAEVVRLLPATGTRSAVTETVGAIAHNLDELIRRLKRTDGPR